MWDCVEGFDVADLERKIATLEQRFLETTIGVKHPNAPDIDLLSELRHRTNGIVERIVTRPNLRFSCHRRIQIFLGERVSEERFTIILQFC